MTASTVKPSQGDIVPKIERLGFRVTNIDDDGCVYLVKYGHRGSGRHLMAEVEADGRIGGWESFKEFAAWVRSL